MRVLVSVCLWFVASACLEVSFCVFLFLQPVLKHVLKDPDADQLLHMLFAPLRLVVDTTRDERGIPAVAQKVESPLLESETCVLMEQSLNPFEVDLWRSLGPAWNIPRFVSLQIDIISTSLQLCLVSSVGCSVGSRLVTRSRPGVLMI